MGHSAHIPLCQRHRCQARTPHAELVARLRLSAPDTNARAAHDRRGPTARRGLVAYIIHKFACMHVCKYARSMTYPCMHARMCAGPSLNERHPRGERRTGLTGGLFSVAYLFFGPFCAHLEARHVVDDFVEEECSAVLGRRLHANSMRASVRVRMHAYACERGSEEACMRAGVCLCPRASASVCARASATQPKAPGQCTQRSGQ